MKKKISVLLSLLTATSLITSACGGGHEHTFSDAWANDATHHWHAATCEHGEEKDGLATHADPNEDGLCDTCGYNVGHKHTFASAWSHNETHHWKSAICSHTGEKDKYGLHEDTDTNAECDTCGAHVHIVNKAGSCDECGEQIIPVDETNMEMVIAAVGVNKDKIVTSQTQYSFSSVIKTVPEGCDEGYNNSQTNVTYTYGVDASYVEKSVTSEARTPNQSNTAMVEANASSATKIWIYTDAQDADNPVKAIQELTENGVTEVSAITSSADAMSGYYYAVSTLAEGYGAESILSALYEMSQDETASGYMFEHRAEENTYIFAFSNLIIHETQTSAGLVINANLFESQVIFKYDDNYALTAFGVQTKCYTNDPGSIAPNQIAEKDISLEFDASTETWKKVADATPSVYTYQTVQTVGERVYTHTKSIEEYKPTGFTFSSNGSAVTDGATLEYSVGDDLEITMACVPATAHFNLVADNITQSIVDKTDSNNTLLSFMGTDGNGVPYIAAYNLPAGEYTLTVTYNEDAILTATVSVAEQQVEGDYIPVTITDNNCFVDLATLNATESGTYTFTIPAGYGAWDQEGCDNNPWTSTPYVDPNLQPEGGSFSVDIAQGDSYSFYVSSPVKGNVKIPYTFVAKEVSGGQGGDQGGDVTTFVDANGLGGEYTFNFVADFTLTFTPDSDGATSGTLTIVDPINSAKSGDYAYTIVDGQYVFTDSSVSVTLDGDAWMFKNASMAMAKPFAQYVAPPVDANGLGGEYTFTFVLKYSLTFTPASNGADSGTLTVVDPINSANNGDYAYTIVDGAYVFTDSNISVTNDGTSWYFQASGMNPAAFTDYVA